MLFYCHYSIFYIITNSRNVSLNIFSFWGNSCSNIIKYIFIRHLPFVFIRFSKNSIVFNYYVIIINRQIIAR